MGEGTWFIMAVSTGAMGASLNLLFIDFLSRADREEMQPLRAGQKLAQIPF